LIWLSSVNWADRSRLIVSTEARRFFLQTADGIEEAYVAFYHQRSESEVVTVYDLRFSDLVTDWVNRPGLNVHLVKLGGQCFDAAEAYVRSLRQ
jgi:hypothetical protein